MDEPSPEIWLARHGETTWSRDWLHTSVTDVPLTERGVEQARDLGRRLAGRSFALVLTSPRLRARRTAELAGFPDAAGRRRPRRMALRELRGRVDGGDQDDGAGLDRLGRIRPLEARQRTTSVLGPTASSHARPSRRRRRPAVRSCARAACPRRTLARPGSDGRPPVPARHGVDLRARLRARDAGDPHAGTPESDVAREDPHLARDGEDLAGRDRRAPSRRRACARPRRAASRPRRSARPSRAGGRRAPSSDRGRSRRGPGRRPRRRPGSRSPPRRPRASRRARPRSCATRPSPPGTGPGWMPRPLPSSRTPHTKHSANSGGPHAPTPRPPPPRPPPRAVSEA